MMPENITIAGALYRNLDGRVDSRYVPIESDYQLSAFRYTATRFPLVLMHPRPDSETQPNEFHRMAQTGQTIKIPIVCAFGSYPYTATIVEAPVGSTIGSWLTANGYGDLDPNDTYCELTIPTPSVGTYSVVVRINDQNGGIQTARWTLNVGNNYYYAAPTTQGTGDGSSPANAASFATAWGANDAAVSPARDKILQLAAGSYSVAASLTLNANKPRVIVAPDGQWAEILSTADNIPVNLNKDGIHLNGIRFKGFRLGSVVVTGNLYHRQSMRRIEFNDCTGDSTVSNNESGWLIFSTNNSTKRNYIWASQISYVNCHEICAFDWYSVGSGLFERSTWTTNQATIEEPIWFPKASCDINMRHLTFDNVTIDFDASVFGVIQIGGNSFYSPATSHVHHCFVRTKAGGHNMIAYNVSEVAVSTENYDEHNTYIGGRVIARNINGDDMVNFDRVVIVNDAGGVTMPNGGGSIITNSLTGTSGIVDSNGRLTDSNRGLIGFQIFAG